jgi:general stress protein 26
MADTRAEHIAQLAELIKDVEVAMFTTTGVDGRLYSRPLATQQVAFDGDLWFVITADSPKVAEIALDPRVNVAYASPSKNTYVSVAGRARGRRSREDRGAVVAGDEAVLPRRQG